MDKNRFWTIRNVNHAHRVNTKKVTNVYHAHVVNSIPRKVKHRVSLVLWTVQNHRQPMKQDRQAIPIAGHVPTIWLLNQMATVGIVVRVNSWNRLNATHVRQDILQTIITKGPVKYVHLVRQQ